MIVNLRYQTGRFVGSPFPLKMILLLLLCSTLFLEQGFSEPQSLLRGEARGEATPPPLVLPELERPKIQRRFLPRSKRLMGSLVMGAHIRDDYYGSLNGGLSAEYFINDTWGVGLSYIGMITWLSDEAEKLREGYGLVPDARAQSSMLGLSALYGLGYGKMLLSSNLVHFDPILGLFAGVATAEERLLPTLKLGFMPTFLLRHEMSLRFDLGVTLQLESRTRGLVLTTGFLPMVSLGWGQLL